MSELKDYIPVVGQAAVDDLNILAERLRGKRIQHVNSTAVGGGVAEILNRMVPLLKEVGVDTCWDVIKGGEQFFEVTKKFHNALHGRPEEVTAADFEIFRETGRKNAQEMDTGADIVFVHDPQPIMLVEKKSGNKWLWRCHIDVSNPSRRVWDFLMDFIPRYDSAVFSAPSFSRRLPIRQFLISPSIDPLSDKNRELPDETVKRVMDKYGIPRDKPVITQISRFDRLKDPVGVIEAFRLARKHADCRLVLAGGTASDDPEGMSVLSEVREKAQGDPDIHILLMKQNDLEINALQRGSTVIMQKSLKEGFGLTVTEALWKGKPVVASGVGGIPLQIKHRYSGLLCHSIDGAAFALKQLLGNPAYAAGLGENGRRHVRNNFLLTTHLRNYLLLFVSLYTSGDVIRI
ncbi:MAG: glycosyltransferase [Candidatus Omnitrophica bacterium]|jgi:trehalose synthase|nr:glycosyltransferase [Candidatus Omnitrophota bacterium]